MIYYIEAPMGGGKTSLLNKRIRNGWTALPDRPEVLKCDDPVEFQRKLFDAYMQAFQGPQLNESAAYVADFSPMGCIPFERALGKWKKIPELVSLADEHEKLIKSQPFWGKQARRLVYIDADSEAVSRNLKIRGITGWPLSFIAIMCGEYHLFFRG